jgi:hypothetical protein
MNPQAANRLDRALAKICRSCPVCRHARKTQAGVAFRLVQNAENGLCPFCRAYERVYGRKPHEPLAKAAAEAP